MGRGKYVAFIGFTRQKIWSLAQLLILQNIDDSLLICCYSEVKNILLNMERTMNQRGVINDPDGQTYSHSNIDHYFPLKNMFCFTKS